MGLFLFLPSPVGIHCSNLQTETTQYLQISCMDYKTMQVSLPSVWQLTGIRREQNPGSFLKGLRNDYHDSTRAYRCPAKGQPLQESFGVFFCALTVLHTSVSTFMGGVEENRRASLPIPGLVIRGATPILCDRWISKRTPGVKRKAARYATAQVIKATSYFFHGVGGGFAVILGNQGL